MWEKFLFRHLKRGFIFFRLCSSFDYVQQKYNLTLMDTISDKESISQEQTSCSLMLNEIRKEFCDILQSKFSLEQGNFVPDTEVSPYFSICWFGLVLIVVFRYTRTILNHYHL